MSEIFRSKGFIMSSGSMDFTLQTVTIEVSDSEIEFRTRLLNDIKIKARLELLKEIIDECGLAGATYLREDKDNNSVIRYTKGIPHTDSKHVTISLSHTDESGVERYQITAEATAVDKYLRRLWK